MPGAPSLGDVYRAAGVAKRPADQAWAAHELGTRALTLGDTAEARPFLLEALDLRRSLGDTEGAAVHAAQPGLVRVGGDEQHRREWRRGWGRLHRSMAARGWRPRGRTRGCWRSSGRRPRATSPTCSGPPRRRRRARPRSRRRLPHGRGDGGPGADDRHDARRVLVRQPRLVHRRSWSTCLAASATTGSRSTGWARASTIPPSSGSRASSARPCA